MIFHLANRIIYRFRNVLVYGIVGTPLYIHLGFRVDGNKVIKSLIKYTQGLPSIRFLEEH